MNYDLIILGGGPAGYHAAERAADAGFSTLVLEERSLGGVCLNEGCIPTKSLLYTAKIAGSAIHGEDYGVIADNVRIDHNKAIERKNAVVKKLVNGVAGSLKQRQVTIINARGVIRNRTENGFAVGANDEVFEGSRLLICTGSAVVIPPIDGIREAMGSGFAVTSREILDMPGVPEKLAIVGGGVIGLEFANYFAISGSDVTIIELLPEVGGPAIDEDIAKNLRANLEIIGVKFLLETKALGLENGAVRVGRATGEETVPSDLVLLSIGRRAWAEGIGLETIGISAERGAVVTDAQMRTNVPGVWAAGDVNGKMMLAHTAYREADVAINNMAGVNDSMRYDVIPQIIYTTPEAAGVGETDRSAKEKGYDVIKAVLPLQYSGRYVAENANGNGFLKLIADKRSRRILGVHIVGSYASEIILSAAVLIGSKYTTSAAEKIVYPHPTVGEVLRDALIELNKEND